jgi:hypothetical protein
MHDSPPSSQLTIDCRLTVDPQVIWQDVLGEAVVLHLETEAYYSVDEVGTEIWKGILEDLPLAEIRDRLTKLFEVSAERCESDLLAFACVLVENRLATIKPSATHE